MKCKKETRGGTRQGSGAKPKYNEPTKTIAFRVPISRIEHVKSLLKTLLDGWAVKNNAVLPPVNGSVYLTENQIAELAQIGSQHLYLYEGEEGRISYGGIMEILKRYEELRKTDR